MRAALLSIALVAAGAALADEVRPLRFKPGADCTMASDAVVRGSRHVYSFRAQKGQWASIGVQAVENNAAFSVWRPGAKPSFGDIVEVEGRTLAGGGEEDDASRWHGRLPDTGTYLVVVGPTRGNATYKLRLQVTAVPPPGRN